MHMAERIVDEEKSIENMIVNLQCVDVSNRFAQFSSEDATLLIKNLVILQLPEIKGQWLDLNTEKLIDTLGDVFTRTDLESLKFLHNIPDKYDEFFAPFCVAFKLLPARVPVGESKSFDWRNQYLTLFTSRCLY